jgi:hypothetical protein
VSRPRSRRRTSPWIRLLVVVGFGAAFVAGLGVGEALNDRPADGGSQTIVRTLKPVTLTAVSPETVTVTTSNH